MSGRSFRSVFMVASCAGAALGCYLVSLRVASERASLEDVETKIALAQRDIRLLQTEIDTRGRLAQLERWNVKVLALAAPSADQFLEGGFALARMTRPQNEIPMTAPVVLASAPVQGPNSAPLGEGHPREDSAGTTSAAAPLLRQASLKLSNRVADVRADTRSTSQQASAAPKPLKSEAIAALRKKAGDKDANPAAKPVTKWASKTKVDPLAPLPAGVSVMKLAKDSGSAR